LILRVFLLIATIAFGNTTSFLEQVGDDTEFSRKTDFGWFLPRTQGERDLERVLRGKDEDIDLALANWLIAADIPQFRNLTREAYFKQLDAMTEQVRQDTAIMQKSGWHGANPNDPDTRCCRFCSAIIRLHFAYAEEFRRETLTPGQTRELYADANDVFLAGLLRTRRGSCVSMPLIYLVVGQRLGFPVHLVAIGKHYFIRWEESDYHMNIEPTIVQKIAMTPDDSVYLDTEGMTHDQVRGSDLRNLTNREIVGQLFFTRYGYWHSKGAEYEAQACLDLSRAHHLAPDDPGIMAMYQAVSNHYGIKPEHAAIDIRITQKH
jgi:hypothetical protein